MSNKFNIRILCNIHNEYDYYFILELFKAVSCGFLLQNILRDFKRHTSKKVVEAIKENPQESRKEWLIDKFVGNAGISFWDTDNHPIELWSNKVIYQKLTYIHNNPVEEGLVFKAEQYVYSSAIDYAGEKGLLNITLIE